ncbi:MAG: hypothetical protein KTR31_08490 [Myxococcales bacterium]|nr:hypothetical protein [Myxococcales bacterium]
MEDILSTAPNNDPMQNGMAHASAALEQQIAQAHMLVRRITELYGVLSREPIPSSDAEFELSALLQQRKQLEATIGQTVVKLTSLGATVGVSGDTAGRASNGPDTVSDVPGVLRRPGGGTAVTPTASRPANGAALRALVDGGITPRWSSTRSMEELMGELRAMAAVIGQPTKIETREDISGAVERLGSAITRMDTWLEQPQDGQKALMGLASSLARQIQDESEYGLTFQEDEALRAAFSRMTAWSRENRPGFVPGLSRSNAPDHGSWLDDGRHWWTEIHRGAPEPSDEITPEHTLAELEKMLEDGVDDRKSFAESVQKAVAGGLSQSDPRLVALLTPYQSMIRGARGLKTLKTALRDALKAEDESEVEEDTSSAVPTDWPMLHLTEGKRAVILGGDPRPLALERIKDAFQLAEAEWEETDVRRVTALASRIKKGNVDIVILLRRFISHREQDLIRPAANEAGVPICVVDTGYGVTQIKLAVERYCAALVPEEEGDEAGQEATP